MASADLDYIRTLLIAQTAAPEPESRGLFGRFALGKRRAPPAPSIQNSAPKPRFDPAAFADHDSSDADQALLLGQICGPAADAATTLVDEALSPLPPPASRAGFGRRSDLDPDLELVLVLDQPVTGQRLQTPVMPAVGDAPMDDAHAVPFFPEDLLEPASPWAPAPPFEPMRPWIKALRNPNAQVVRAEPAQNLAAEPTRKPRPKRVKAAGPAAPPAAPTGTCGLGHDLLSALALTLAHEQDRLADRLLAVASEATFAPEQA